MEAYAAVHNSEAKEEFYSQRDLISEMNTGNLSDNDLREIAEEVCETLFDQGVTVKEAIAFIDEVLAEGENVGRNKKVSRLYAAFAEAFDTITSKANQLEEFAKYRQSKKLQETWSARHNQEKRIQRHHSVIVAEDRAAVKAGLLELYKGKHGQSEKEYQDSRSDAGKMVSGDSKMSGSAYSSRATRSTGPNPAGGSKKPEGQGRMTTGAREDLKLRKANMKAKSMKEAWADAYKSVYEVDEAAKPDYLDFDKDGNKKESMKKALKDKKKGNPKHGMKGHKCDDDCDHDENGGDMSEAKDFIQKAIKRPGAFTAKAKERGMDAKEFASKVTANSKDYDERTVKQANLAKTLSGLKKEEQDFDAILQEVQKDGTPIEEALWIIANTTI